MAKMYVEVGVINCKINVTNLTNAEKSQSMELTRLHSPSWCLALLLFNS